MLFACSLHALRVRFFRSLNSENYAIRLKQHNTRLGELKISILTATSGCLNECPLITMWSRCREIRNLRRHHLFDVINCWHVQVKRTFPFLGSLSVILISKSIFQIKSYNLVATKLAIIVKSSHLLPPGKIGYKV